MPDSLERLAGGKQPFLDKHHLAAAERLERLVQRACLAPRLTMSYGSSTVASRGQVNIAGDLSDIAADARTRINGLAERLPPDCWDVLFDVCGLGLGLQEIEVARQWPRRSAKLVLRIGLEQLAREFGLAPHIAGHHGGRVSGWLERRPPMFPDSPP
jgi:hypothetical protein